MKVRSATAARRLPRPSLLTAAVLAGVGLGLFARRRRGSPAAADFARRYRRALADPRLAGNLLAFQRAWRPARAAAFAELAEESPELSSPLSGAASLEGSSAGDDHALTASDAGEALFERLRDEMARTKDDVLADLPGYFARFRAAAERAGATVVEAADAEAANAYVAELAARRGARLVIKGKSMVSEETGLNHYLAERGLEVVETDLGEWIVQLADERPSHMVMPAIHKSRQQVGELFTRVLGREISRESIPEQVGVARTELRRKFLEAEIGISGANALIAESGTVMLVTNEGNGRQVTSLPPVHVVVVGYEKLLPTYADAMRQLRLLARSATAQHLTSYTTFITGPDRPDKELHIVFVDNGRLAMRDDPAFRDVLRCIRCAACANVCPPYQVVGGHVFGYVYSGAIGLVNTPFHHGLDHAAGPQSLCVSCNACATVCPVRIPLPRQILAVRARVASELGLASWKRVGLAVWSRPWLLDLACRLGARASAPLADGPFLRLPLPAAWRWRTPPRPAPRPARDRLGGRRPGSNEVVPAGARGGPSPASPAGRGRPSAARTGEGLISFLRGDAPTPALPRWGRARRRAITPTPTQGERGPTTRRAPLRTGAAGLSVACFLQCLTDRFLPEVAEATVQVLEACGARVVIPPAQPCCGLPALDAGDERTARRMARATIRALSAVEADFVVTPGASCVVSMAHDYPALFADDPDWRRQAEELAPRVLDLTSFLLRVARLDGAALEPRPSASGPAITLHPFCQSINVLGLGEAQRRLIEAVLGYELRELPEARVCCGFGGSTSLEHPAVARAIVARKLANVAATGAPVLVTDNPGCLLHLRGAADAAGQPLQVLHLAELVAARLAAHD